VRSADGIANAGEQSEHGDAAGPSVDFGTPVVDGAYWVAESCDDLWAVECRTSTAGGKLGLAAAEMSRQTKVEELELKGVGVDENVLGLDVTMTDLQRMVNGVYGREELIKDTVGYAGGEYWEMRRRLLGPHSQKGLECDIAIQVLFDEVKVARSANGLVDIDEIGMGWKLG